MLKKWFLTKLRKYEFRSLAFVPLFKLMYARDRTRCSIFIVPSTLAHYKVALIYATSSKFSLLRYKL